METSKPSTSHVKFQYIKKQSSTCSKDYAKSLLLQYITGLFTDDKSSSKISYSLIYDELLKCCQMEIIDDVIVYTKTSIEKFLEDNSRLSVDLTSEDVIKAFILSYITTENVVQKVKMLLTNNKTRFETGFMLKINSLNAKIFINDYLKNHQGSEILAHIKKYVVTCTSLNSENSDFMLSTIHFIQNIGAKELFNEIVDIDSNKILSKFEDLLREEIISENNLAQFLESFHNKINNEVYQFKIFFGEQYANSLYEKLVQQVFINRLPMILTNDKVMNTFISLKDFSTLNMIYKIMNRKNETLNLFQTKIFEFFVEKFFYDIGQKIPVGPKEGIAYIELLISRMKVLNEMFERAFLKDRRMQLKYRETLHKMVNNKMMIKTTPTLCGIYINEVLARNIDNFTVVKESIASLIQIVQLIDEVETFFLTVQKLMIKRISNFKFIKDNELFLVNSLKSNFGPRFCFPIYRVLNDMKESDRIYQEVVTNITHNPALSGFFKIGNINLLSFNSINKNDLAEVIHLIGKDPSAKEVNILGNACTVISQYYQTVYPHRVVTYSQNLTSCVVTYLKKFDVIVNLIQTFVLLLFNMRKKIKLGDLMTELLKENKYSHVLRANILALVHSEILISSSGKSIDLHNTDELEPNQSFNPKDAKPNINEMTYIFLKKDAEGDLKKTDSTHLDVTSLESSMESQANIYNANKTYIIDSKLISIVKHGTGVQDTQLIKALITDEFIKKYISPLPDITFIKKRIEMLVEKNLITMKFEEGKIVYYYA